MKIILSIIVVAVILTGGFFLLNNYIYTEKQGEQATQPGYDDVSYWIDGTSVRLTGGVSEIQVPDSTAVTVTRIFGNEAEGDINADGISDIAFILTQNTGGSGTFYYAVAALKTDDGYQGLNAIFLGDRIAPQSTEIREGEVIVNYADRPWGEAMVATPSVGMSKVLYVENAKLIERTDSVGKEEEFLYIHIQEAPKVELSDGEFSCDEEKITGESHDINGRVYCVTHSTEGAAGSTYTTYEYITAVDNFVAQITFTIRMPQCLNYDEPEQSACVKEQASFNVDEYADNIAGGITMQ
jgi:hypothetical protein